MATPVTATHTTLVSLFHTEEQAHKALTDLRSAGLANHDFEVIGGSATQTSAPEHALAHLQSLNLPAKDMQILADGLKDGGTLIVVRAEHSLATKAESIFEHHHAGQIDERTTKTPAEATATNSDGMVSVIEEQMVVGKRTVERGGVRLVSRLVEVPVEEQVTLREEHATIERHAVDRPISDAEIKALKNESIEVREMAEEAVVGKTSRVVEEIRVGKTASERTEHISDTVRKTQVDVDQMPVETVEKAPRKS